MEVDSVCCDTVNVGAGEWQLVWLNSEAYPDKYQTLGIKGLRFGDMGGWLEPPRGAVGSRSLKQG